MIKTEKYLISQKLRSSPLPVKGLPLSLRGVGHFYIPRGHIPPTRYSTYTVMAWGISGQLKIRIEDMGIFILSEEQIMIIAPGLKFDLEVVSDECEFRYLAVDGPQASNTILAAGLWTGLFPCREAPTGWLENLETLIDSNKREELILAASRTHDLFVFQADLAKEMIKDNLIYQAQWFFHRNWNDCDVNVETVIKYLNVDRATLSKRFKDKTGISMLEYLTNIRISSAKKYLKTTCIQISDITTMCGYKDASYFSRLFRRRTSCTPLQYRLGNESSDSKVFIIPATNSARKR